MVVYISLGSNLGSRINNLRDAVDLLPRYLSDIKCSPVIETQAIVPHNSPSSWETSYLNMVISGKINIAPDTLLKGLKGIEHELGRPEKYERWEPRLIDLDILFIDNLNINEQDLQIPHSELLNRPFLLHLLSMIGCNSRFFINYIKDTKLDFKISKSLTIYPALVGIVNVTLDSFSDGGQYYNLKNAIEQIFKLVKDGASVIDIGAQSTRPEAKILSYQEELRILESILDAINPLVKEYAIRVSIDSFLPEVIETILNRYNISWINDQKGNLSDLMIKKIADKNCKYCVMHSLDIPANTSNFLPLNINPIEIIKDWGKAIIHRLNKLGIAKENIILDPGIGFGKTPYQNIRILQTVNELKKLGVKILIGHSRKSFINTITDKAPIDRDAETIAISLALSDKIDFVRVHNVKNHMNMLAPYNLINL